MNVVMLWLRVAAWLFVWLFVWLFGCERLGWLLGRFWAIGAALDGWEVVVAVELRLVKGRRGEAGCWW